MSANTYPVGRGLAPAELLFAIDLDAFSEEKCLPLRYLSLKHKNRINLLVNLHKNKLQYLVKQTY